MTDTTDTVEGGIEEPELAPWKGPVGLRALRSRDFALFWAGMIVSVTGTWMQMLAQGWLVFELTHSQLYLGIVSAAGTLPIMLLTLPGGVVADRLNKRKIVITTQTAAAVLALLLSALAYSGAIKPWHIVIFAVLNGCVNAIDMPARQSMVMELVGRNDLVNAVALTSSAFNAARIVGPAIAGLIVAAGGAASCFFINGVSYAAVIVALIMVRSTQFRTASNVKPVLSEIVEGLRYARGNALIRSVLVMTAMMSIFAMQYASQMPALAKGVLGVGPKGLGMLVSAAGIGALAAGAAVAGLGHLLKQRTMVVTGSLVAPTGIILLSVTHSYPLSVACLAVIGFGTMLFMTVSNSMVQMATPDTMRGRLLSLRTLLFSGVAPLGALQIGAMAQYWGVQPALRFGAIVCGLAALHFAVRQGRMHEPR